MTDAYTAFQETEPCHRCGDGESWTVKGPDGACIGQSWTGDDAECEAEEEAQALNAAYEHGRASLMDLLRQAHAWISEDTEALQASHMPYNDTDPIDIEVRAEVDARKAWLAAFQPTSNCEGHSAHTPVAPNVRGLAGSAVPDPGSFSTSKGVE